MLTDVQTQDSWISKCLVLTSLLKPPSLLVTKQSRQPQPLLIKEGTDVLGSPCTGWDEPEGGIQEAAGTLCGGGGGGVETSSVHVLSEQHMTPCLTVGELEILSSLTLQRSRTSAHLSLGLV